MARSWTSPPRTEAGAQRLTKVFGKNLARLPDDGRITYPNLMRPISNASPDDDGLMNYGQTHALAARGGPAATFFEWMETYQMNGHAELGRPGVVCPFTRKARTIDSMRFTVSDAGAADEAAVFAMIRKSFAQLDRIPVAKGSEVSRR